VAAGAGARLGPEFFEPESDAGFGGAEFFFRPKSDRFGRNLNRNGRKRRPQAQNCETDSREVGESLQTESVHTLKQHQQQPQPQPQQQQWHPFPEHRNRPFAV
jgi:hypothetical protein